MNKKTTLVLGASTSPSRISNLAIQRLRMNDVAVHAFGRSAGVVADVAIQTNWSALADAKIHTVTMYLAPENQADFYDKILTLNPKRIIFNPGSENAELATLARTKGIECVNECTLVLLSIKDY